MLAHGAEQSEAGQWAAHYAKEAALDTVPRPALPLQTADERQPRRALRARADGLRAGRQALCVEQRTPYPEFPARPVREQDAVARRMEEEAARRAAVCSCPCAPPAPPAPGGRWGRRRGGA